MDSFVGIGEDREENLLTVHDTPGTPFKSIVNRGGNNPDGEFVNNFVSLELDGGVRPF